MLAWNEIRDRASRFSREWVDETRETGEYQSFWNEFFEVFGIRRRSVALYQKKVSLLAGRRGFIDLFWPGTFLVEHKSAGEDLNAAFTQATDYFAGLAEEEKPRFVAVTDYKRVRLYDLEGEHEIEETEFNLREFSKNVRCFAFIAGYAIRAFRDEDPINVKAVRAIGRLHDAILASNYPPEGIDKLLTRFVFCLFADDTAIFNRDTFKNYLEDVTKVDGSDIGGHLSTIFQILDTPVENRQTTLDEDLVGLPYVNGGLFRGYLPLLFGTAAIRDTLLKATAFDWSAVSPAIFGSMFQSVMNEEERHDLGAHYTSEKNIMKVITGLFLDDLKKELDEAGNNHAKLRAFWDKLAKIKLLDPACGCGNFLVVSYRELRLLELEIIRRIYAKAIDAGQDSMFDANAHSRLNVDQMYGIEIKDFPARIAELALWLTDHQMNQRLSDLLGRPTLRLPLKTAPHIVVGNALHLDWREVAPQDELSYILGNPPFISKQDRDGEQKADMETVFGKIQGGGELDYVAAWYKKATDYIQGTHIAVAFVSTNSVTQGEQVGILWPLLLKMGIVISFAHRTFRWTNEATGKAAVHCVIIGFSLNAPSKRQLFDYEDPAGEPHLLLVRNINPYLIDADNIVIRSRRDALCSVPEAVFGSMPNDAGQFLFIDDKERDDFLRKEPSAAKSVRPMMSAKEYLQGGQRYCLWLKNASPEEIRQLPQVRIRVENVRLHREMSTREATRALAKTPYLFGEDRQPEKTYILIPRVSSERRRYVPLGFFGPENIAGDTSIVIPGATLYHFGILQSEMHMAWLRQVCGRMKSDYRYSNELVYNNFPWPENPTNEQKKTIDTAAQAVLDARRQFPAATLADLYDTETMPKALLNAHQVLDRAVDHCYGAKKFASESARLEFLFALYEKYSSPLLASIEKPKKKTTKT